MTAQSWINGLNLSGYAKGMRSDTNAYAQQIDTDRRDDNNNAKNVKKKQLLCIHIQNTTDGTNKSFYERASIL